MIPSCILIWFCCLLEPLLTKFHKKSLFIFPNAITQILLFFLHGLFSIVLYHLYFWYIQYVNVTLKCEMHDVWPLASLFYDQNCSLWLESRQLSLITGTTQVFIASTVLKCFQHLDFNYFLDIIIIINPPPPPPSPPIQLYRALKIKLCYFVLTNNHIQKLLLTNTDHNRCPNAQFMAFTIWLRTNLYWA